MADVTAIAYLGGLITHGGISPNAVVDSAGAYESLATRDALAHRVVPDNASTGASISGVDPTWYPVFDGTKGTLYVQTSATATTVTVTPGPSWTVNQWAGFLVRNANASGLGLRNRDIVVISNTADTITVAAWTATPESGSSLWFNVGEFADTHINAAWRTNVEALASAIPTRGGASWQNDNVGLSPVPSLVRELWENVWPTAPFFQLCHYYTTAPVVGGFDATTGSARAALITEKARWDAAWIRLATGNTLVWDYCVIDMSQNDVLDWVGTPANAALFRAALTEMIDWLRSSAVFSNDAMQVVLINHDVAINNVAVALGTATANTHQNTVTLAGVGVSVLSFDGRGYPLRGVDDDAAPTWVPSLNAAGYATSVYLRDYPRALRQSIALIAAGAAPSSSGALPVYVVLGDSLVVGQGFTSAYSDALDDAVLTGTVRDSRQQIWNASNGAAEAYDAHTNSNTSGTVSSAAGLEFSLIEALMRRHPTTGALIIKRGSNGSSLAAAVNTYSAGGGGRWSKTYASTEHYDALRADLEAAFQYINVTLGKQAELMGFVVGLGTVDQALAGGGAVFATELPTFCENLRADFGTHTTGAATPIMWLKPHLGAATAISAESVAVRAALVARERADAQFALVDIDDLTRGADNTHLAPDSTIDAGYRIETALGLIALPNC